MAGVGVKKNIVSETRNKAELITEACGQERQVCSYTKADGILVDQISKLFWRCHGMTNSDTPLHAGVHA